MKKFVDKFCVSCQYFNDARKAAMDWKNAPPQPDGEEPRMNSVNPFSSCFVMSAHKNVAATHMFLFDKLIPEFEPPSLCPYRLEYVMMMKK